MKMPPMTPLVKLAWSVASAGILALGGWVYSTAQRVATVEAHVTAQDKQLNDIHDDVRDLRTFLMGTPPPRKP